MFGCPAQISQFDFDVNVTEECIFVRSHRCIALANSADRSLRPMTRQIFQFCQSCEETSNVIHRAKKIANYVWKMDHLQCAELREFSDEKALEEYLEVIRSRSYFQHKTFKMVYEENIKSMLEASRRDPLQHVSAI